MKSDHSHLKDLSTLHIIKDKLKTIFWITISWMLIAFYQYFDSYAVLLNEGLITESYKTIYYIKGIFLSTILGGVLGGSSLVFLWEKWLRNKKFSTAALYILISYSTLYLFIAVMSVLAFDSNQTILNSDNRIAEAIGTIFHTTQLPNFIFWLFMILATFVVMLIRDKFGPQQFNAFLKGKYFTPRREERIFMFMNLRSSTTIAEKLGEENYFNFLNDVFKTSTPSIQNTNGEIYQYVGDEIVISWTLENGLDELNCIRCFYSVTDALKSKKQKFMDDYGFIPEFKAGLHVGNVIAGEMGIVKREIVYSGDVLNTTARIQEKCNELGTDILISKQLIQKLDLEEYQMIPKELEELDLKGKKEKITVLTM